MNAVRFSRSAAVWCGRLLVLLFASFPLVWGLLTSFKSPKDILGGTWLPQALTLDNYRSIFRAGVGSYLANSLAVSAATVAICLAIGILAGYALARFRFRGKQAFTVAIVAVMSIPIASLLVPTYTLMAEASLVNSRVGLTLVYSAYQLPIVIWIVAAYCESLPIELEWSAQMDGYSRLRVLWKVVLPLAKPALIASILFVLTFAWNDFVVAVTLLSSEEVRTLPIGIYNFLGFYGREWGPLLAASMVSIMPLVALFVWLQRYFVAGITGGGVKG